ncbi:MAG: division/cell wall cluster transcriptional repressor MraZ [Desulfovibrionaceae bacterium]
MKLRGHAHRSLDAKGRLILPPNFKDLLLKEAPEGLLVLTLFDKHVIGMTPAQWEATEAELEKVESPSREFQLMKRILFSGYVEIALDGQGRLPIPTHLRKSGRLEKDVVVLGAGRRFEIWSASEHEELLSQDFDVSQEMAENGVKLPF